MKSDSRIEIPGGNPRTESGTPSWETVVVGVVVSIPTPRQNSTEDAIAITPNFPDQYAAT